MALVSAIQMTSTTNVAENLSIASDLIAEAAKEGAALVVLPENFSLMSDDEQHKIRIKERYGQGRIQDFLAEQANKHGLWIVGGTIPIAGIDDQRVRAACIVYDDQGKAVARYDKIHLFDVVIPEVGEVYRESRGIEAGEQVTVIDTPIGKLGIAVCYDLRFPELFRQMLNQGMEILAVPTAFTIKTGQAHWDTLIRARAIENLCYGVYACETGQHSLLRTTYGHSSIVDPWGNIVKQLDQGVGVITADIDLNYLKNLRQNFPAISHQRIFKT